MDLPGGQANRRSVPLQRWFPCWGLREQATALRHFHLSPSGLSRSAPRSSADIVARTGEIDPSPNGRCQKYTGRAQPSNKMRFANGPQVTST